jgi:hypothetical protein
VNPFGVSFSLINKSDLILVNHSGQVIDGGEVRLLNTAAYMIHSAIHAARPDVMCAAHSHSIYGRTWCTLGRKIDSLTQDACAFHDDHVVYDSFNGVVLAEKEGKNIAKCLGNRKAALLQNHGLLTVGKTIEEGESGLAPYPWEFGLVLLIHEQRCSGSCLWRNAAIASLWLRLRLLRGASTLLRLVMRRPLTPTGRLGRRRRVGSVRSPCLTLFTRRRMVIICNEMMAEMV